MAQKQKAKSKVKVFDPIIRRAKLDHLTVYEISEAELEVLHHGSPGSLYLNFAIFLISLAASFLITLLFTNIPSQRTYVTFLTLTVIGFVLGFLLALLWLISALRSKDIVKEIKNRLPPIGDQLPP